MIKSDIARLAIYFLESGIFRAIFILSQIYQPIIVNFRAAYVISYSLQIKNSKI